MLTREHLTGLLATLGDTARAVATADPEDKAMVYGELGITVTFDPLARHACDCDVDTAACGKCSCRRAELSDYPTGHVAALMAADQLSGATGLQPRALLSPLNRGREDRHGTELCGADRRNARDHEPSASCDSRSDSSWYIPEPSSPAG